jgi:two-component system cell cycle sensor histidine kinase/response regulator CckA
VQLTIADTGSGIPENIMLKIFEPFFTTKERGKGTGLGLSMAYSAIKKHNGHITVQSVIGSGSAFTVSLPISRELSLRVARETAAPLSGNEVILFVDDDENVLSAFEDTLSSRGYKVFAASDPVEALDLFKRMSSEIALVITDIVMPKIDGRELIRQMRSFQPDVKILAVSGNMKYVAEKEDIKEIAGFLQKPFESRDLLAVIRRILDSSLKKPRTT